MALQMSNGHFARFGLRCRKAKNREALLGRQLVCIPT